MSQQQKKVPETILQILINNRLDKYIQGIVYSFNFALNLFLSSKYNVRNNHIYPSGKIYRVFGFSCMLCMNAMCFYQILTCDFLFLKNKLELLVFTFFTVVSKITIAIGFTMMFILDSVHKNNNVLLILKIQTLYRSINFSRSIQNFVFWNWISLATVVCTNFIIYVMFYGSFDYYDVGLIFAGCCHIMWIALDINFSIAIRIIILLRKYLEEWIKDISTINNEQENYEHTLKLLEIYRNIMKAYNLYQKIFDVLALFHTLNAFYHTLCCVNTMVYILKMYSKMGNEALIRTFGLILWLTKDLALVIMHCTYCEKFYITVEEAETACIQLMKDKNCPKSRKHHIKNVIHSNRSFSKMTACGLFYVDTTLSMSLVGAVSNYVIVLLQLLFL